MVRAEPEMEGPSTSLDEWQLDREKFQAGLAHEMEQLSENHRAVLVLRFQEELPLKEISRILDCSEGTVKSRLFYALRKLGNKLQVFDPKS